MASVYLTNEEVKLLQRGAKALIAHLYTFPAEGSPVLTALEVDASDLDQVDALFQQTERVLDKCNQLIYQQSFGGSNGRR